MDVRREGCQLPILYSTNRARSSCTATGTGTIGAKILVDYDMGDFVRQDSQGDIFDGNIYGIILRRIERDEMSGVSVSMYVVCQDVGILI